MRFQTWSSKCYRAVLVHSPDTGSLSALLFRIEQSLMSNLKLSLLSCDSYPGVETDPIRTTTVNRNFQCSKQILITKATLNIKYQRIEKLYKDRIKLYTIHSLAAKQSRGFFFRERLKMCVRKMHSNHGHASSIVDSPNTCMYVFLFSFMSYIIFTYISKVALLTSLINAQKILRPGQIPD